MKIYMWGDYDITLPDFVTQIKKEDLEEGRYNCSIDNKNYIVIHIKNEYDDDGYIEYSNSFYLLSKNIDSNSLSILKKIFPNLEVSE